MRAEFELTAGPMADHASSDYVVRGFCRDCGTGLTYWNRTNPLDIDVTTVTLDDPTPLAPQAHVWVSDKLSWFVINDALPQFSAGMPLTPTNSTG